MCCLNQDLKLIREMPSIQVLSLSVNKISSLKDFGYCPKLRQLFLRKNNVHDIREIKHLVNLPVLAELWLNDNPCANVKKQICRLQTIEKSLLNIFPNYKSWITLILQTKKETEHKRILLAQMVETNKKRVSMGIENLKFNNTKDQALESRIQDKVLVNRLDNNS